MYIVTNTVRTIPGKRFAGIDHLKKVAKWMSEKCGVRTDVLGNVNSRIYENHLVSRFETMAQMEEFEKTIYSDPEFLEWFAGSEGLVEWQDATRNLYEVVE